MPMVKKKKSSSGNHQQKLHQCAWARDWCQNTEVTESSALALLKWQYVWCKKYTRGLAMFNNEYYTAVAFVFAFWKGGCHKNVCQRVPQTHRFERGRWISVLLSWYCDRMISLLLQFYEEQRTVTGLHKARGEPCSAPVFTWCVNWLWRGSPPATSKIR